MDRPALLAAVALLALTAGCLSTLADPPSREDRAVDRLEEARAALGSVETYRYTGTAAMVATDGPREERIEAELHGAVDVAERRARSTQVAQTGNRSAYAIGEHIYRECPAIAVSWGVENRTIEGDWVETTAAGRHLQLLESGSLRLAGAESVDGRETTVLAGRPSSGALERFVEVTPRRLVGGPELRRPRVKVWLDNGSARPVKSHLTFSVSDGDETASFEITTRYHADGDPVTIALPTAAREEPWSGPCPG